MMKPGSSATPCKGDPPPTDPPELNGSDGENRTVSLQPYYARCVTPSIITTHVSTSKNSKSKSNIYEDRLDTTIQRDGARTFSIVRSASTGYSSRDDRENENPQSSLTTRALHEYNLQQTYIPRLSGIQPISNYEPVAMQGLGPALINGTIHGLEYERAGCFLGNYLIHPPQTQAEKQISGSMINEADCNSPSYQSSRSWQPEASDQHGAADMPAPDSDQEPAAWGYDLAGIGEHLADYASQEYASHSEIMMDW